jgi:hypothetical protein
MSRGAAEGGTIDIAFIAISQAHQFAHWLPAALRLAREPSVRVTVLSSTEAGADYVRAFNPDGSLTVRLLHGAGGELFDPPWRLKMLLLNAATFARFPVLVTTETTSSWLRRLPGFRSRMVHLKHGAGDREGGYDPKHANFDLTLVNGPKDKERLIQRGLGTDQNIKVVGYGKFELVRPVPAPLFANDRPIALYNPHFDAEVGTWIKYGAEVVRAMESIPDWNFVAAPHVRIRGGPDVASAALNVIIDRGSVRSIDMTYTHAASVYIGDVSSQVYEFIRTPRPCIFLNLDRREWQHDPAYAHWHFGQVIDDLADLPAALARADEVQPQFDALQRERLAASIDESPIPASERQAQAILEFARHG